MTEISTIKDWFVFSARKKPIEERSMNTLLAVSLSIMTITSMIRYWLLDYLDYKENMTYCTFDCRAAPSITFTIIAGLRVVLFHFVLYFILQLAYPENSTIERKQKVAFAAQLWSIADILFLILYGSYSIKGINFSSDYWSLQSAYTQIFATCTIIALFYIGRPIFERLKLSFEEYSWAVFVGLILSAIVYWISYGLGWILGELILLPFGGA